MVTLYDASMLIHETMIVYPHNPAPKIEQYAHIPTEVVNESKISLGCHTGTHVDAPFHVRNDGGKADSIDLHQFYGPCLVVDLTHIDREIHQKDLEFIPLEPGLILCLKTQNSLIREEKFRTDFVHVKIDAARYLIGKGIKTLGFDYLSVKKFGGDDDVHELLITNLTLFEGLNLAHVPAGQYTFVGLPLKVACDGAPARVLLIAD